MQRVIRIAPNIISNEGALSIYVITLFEHFQSYLTYSLRYYCYMVDIWYLLSCSNCGCNMTYFKAVVSFGMVVHGSYNHKPISGAIWHILHGIGLYFMVWYSVAWHWMELHGVVWRCVALHCIACHGVAGSDMALPSVVWHWMSLCGVALDSVAWYGMAWHCMALHDISWCCMTWHVIACHGLSLHCIGVAWHCML